MATKRKITLFFNSEGKEVEYMTDARTFGELCDQVTDYDLSSKKVVDEETRHIFEAVEAILPEGECVLYVYNRKSKAGAAVPKAFKKITPDKVHTFPMDTIRKFASFLNKEKSAGIDGKQNKDALQKSVRKWMIKNGWPSPVATSSPGKTSKSAKGLEKKVAEKVKETTKAASPASTVAPKPLESASKPGTTLQKRVGPATLDMMDDKLDLILEELSSMRAKRTVEPISTSSEERRKRANAIKGQLYGVQG